MGIQSALILSPGLGLLLHAGYDDTTGTDTGVFT